MKFERNFALFCNYACESRNGNISLIEVFQRFHFPKFPSIPVRCFFVMDILGPVGRHEVNLKLVDSENKTQLFNFKQIVSINENQLKFGMVVQLNGIVFPKSDTYLMRVNIADSLKFIVSLPVKQVY